MNTTPTQSRRIAEFCGKWQVVELWVFGSVARGEARSDSDIDILVKFRADAATSFWDWPAMRDELREIFGREVDLLSEGVLKNPFRRAAILADRQVLYAA